MQLLRKIILPILAGWLIGYGAAMYASPVLSAAGSQTAIISPVAATPADPAVQPGIPVRLVIPALHVDTVIEQVGNDPNGRMAVPVRLHDAGWYSPGVRPGAVGNAVIDGHVNTPELTPNIFYHLDTLKPGDTILLTDNRQQTWKFAVTENTNVRTTSFPIQEIFGPTNKTRLNLITCAGVYQRNRKDYSQRTVVYSELVGMTTAAK